MKLAQLADSYTDSTDLILTDADKAELERFILNEYRHFRRLGICITLTSYDPYDSHDQMVRDVLIHRTLKVYIGGTESPIMTQHLNVMFRAVHDLHHVLAGGDFTIEGEIKAFQYVAQLLKNPRLISLMFSEIVLQAATTLHTGVFPEQRIVDSPLVAQFSPGGHQ